MFLTEDALGFLDLRFGIEYHDNVSGILGLKREGVAAAPADDAFLLIILRCGGAAEQENGGEAQERGKCGFRYAGFHGLFSGAVAYFRAGPRVPAMRAAFNWQK